jgi:hypothetical protein
MLKIEDGKRFLGIMPAVAEDGMGAKIVCFFHAVARYRDIEKFVVRMETELFRVLSQSELKTFRSCLDKWKAGWSHVGIAIEAIQRRRASSLGSFRFRSCTGLSASVQGSSDARDRR